MRKVNIAVTIQNYVQFYSIKLLIDELLKKSINVDIYVPVAKDDWGLKEMFEDIYNYLISNGYNPRRNPLKIKYKILLEPYPMEYYFSFNYEYRIKYKYCAISAKPSLTYKIESNFVYDAILCHSTYEQEVLSCYSKTYLVGKLNYCNFEKTKKTSKEKTILYLPTYGNLNSINEITNELIKLRSKYRIITKEHHGTDYFNYEKEKREKLSIFDECYDSKMPLEDLLKKADVVLTDNSGSIFEAIYTNIPVCIFSKNIKDCSLGDIDSLQLQLIRKKVIPYTDNQQKIDTIIKSALSKEYRQKQKQISEKLFPVKSDNNNVLSSYTNVIDLYLNLKDDILSNRIKLHKKIINEFESNREEVKYLKKENELLSSKEDDLNLLINQLKSNNNLLAEQLNEYQKGKLYKLSTKIYSFMSNFRRKNKL